MNDDISDLMAKINSMLGSDSDNNLKDLINNASSNSSNNNSSNNNSANTSNFEDSSEDNGFNIDFNTIMKIKSIMEAMNSKKNDPRAKLLMSLKPYLKDSRKQKLDQYVQLLNMSRIFELLKEKGGDFNSHSN